MYASFYGLQFEPFQSRPDLRYFYDSKAYRHAMAYFDYGLAQEEGCIVITGDSGAGKTTLMHKLFGQLVPAQVHAARVANTELDGGDVLRMVAAGFALPSEPMSQTALLDNIDAMLHRVAAQGRRSLLVLDQAHTLSPRAQGQLSLLASIQSGGRALLQIFLLGQSSLRDLLKAPAMEALRQRLLATHHLESLEAIETCAYIEHRLRAAGWHGQPVIGAQSLAAIHTASGGLPRRINTVCEHLLRLGSLDQLDQLEVVHVAAVLRDLARDAAWHAPAVAGTPVPAPSGQRAAAIEQSMLAVLGAVGSPPAKGSTPRTAEQP